MQFVIETERLLLRRFTEDDAPLIFALNQDPDVTRFTLDPVTDLPQAQKIITETFLPQYALYNYGRWAVYAREDLQFTGWCGLKYRPEQDETDLGYRFMKKYWGLGYATESARASLQHGFNHLQLTRIVGRSLPGNHASIRVLEKCGMQYLGEEIVDGLLHKTYHALKPAINA